MRIRGYAISGVVLVAVYIGMCLGAKKVVGGTWTSAATLIAPLILLAGFYFAWRQFDAARKQRMSEIALKLVERWDSPALEESRKKLNELGTKEKVKAAMVGEEANSDELYVLARVGNFFDTVGALVAEGYLDKEIAYDLMAPPFETYYGLYKGLIDDPSTTDYFPCIKKLESIFAKVKGSRKKTEAKPT